jgi:signal transduction histidine kinase
VSGWRRAGRSIRRGLGSLRWQLTLSYALVTITAALTLSLVSAAIQASRGEISVDQAGAPRVLQKDAARAMPYLTSGASPDVVRFLVALPTVDDLAGLAHGRGPTVGVLDASGRLIVADDCTQQQHTRSAAAACRARAGTVVVAFLHTAAGRRAVGATVDGSIGGQPMAGNASGRGYVVAPVPGTDKQPGGALVAIFDGAVPAAPSQSALAAFLALWSATWPQGWLAMVLVTVVLGTAIGLLLSYRLLRRTRSMAAIVGTWSRGDLEASIDARGGGELGRLGADLNEMAEQMRNLLRTRAEIARQEERRRLQRDLHDGIKQELFATSMHLAAARALLPSDAGGAISSLEKAQGTARRAQSEVGAMLEQEAPTVAPDDLYTAVSEIVRQFEAESAICVTQDVPAHLHLPAQVDDAVVRVIQEALTNIRRHAGASAVTITASVERGELRLLVTDDGHGFPVERCAHRGLGLTIMRERVESLRGRFSIESAEPGTTINLAIPVES